MRDKRTLEGCPTLGPCRATALIAELLADEGFRITTSCRNGTTVVEAAAPDGAGGSNWRFSCRVLDGCGEWHRYLAIREVARMVAEELDADA